MARDAHFQWMGVCVSGASNVICVAESKGTTNGQTRAALTSEMCSEQYFAIGPTVQSVSKHAFDGK